MQHWDIAEVGPVLNASDYGIPQRRERVYFVFVRDGVSYTTPLPTHEEVFLSEFVTNESLDYSVVVEREDQVLTKDPYEISHAMKPIRIGHVNHAHQGERIYHCKGHAVTISANTGGAGRQTGLYWVDDIVRRLTPIECKKVMGFPAEHVVTDGTAGYKQLGNAVIPRMVEHIASGLTF